MRDSGLDALDAAAMAGWKIPEPDFDGLKASRRKLRRGISSGCLIGLFTLVLWTVVFVWMAQGLEDEPRLAILLFLWGLTGAGLVLWAQLKAIARRRRSSRGPRVVLWLRRFDRGEHRSRRFLRSLARASEGLATGLTLRDSSVLKSDLSWHPLMLISFEAGALATYAIHFVVVWETGGVGLPYPVQLVLLGLFTYATWWLWGPNESTRLRGDDELGQRELLERLRTPANQTGAWEVGACSNEDWQPVVRFYVEEADLVILDVTDIGEGMRWEIEQVARLCEPERVLMAFLAEDAESSARVRDELRTTFPTTFLERCHILPFGPGNRFGIGKELAARIHTVLRSVEPRAKSWDEGSGEAPVAMEEPEDRLPAGDDVPILHLSDARRIGGLSLAEHAMLSNHARADGDFFVLRGPDLDALSGQGLPPELLDRLEAAFRGHEALRIPTKASTAEDAS